LRTGAQEPELTARAFLFVLADEVLPSGKVVRKVMVAPDHLTRGLRVVQIIGLVVSVYDLAKAGQQSIETRSAAPITREGIRQVGGWGGAVVAPPATWARIGWRTGR
jgi:hypothetical protein